MSSVVCDLLIVGTSIDAHITAVLDELPEDIRVARLDVDQYPADQSLSVDFSGTSFRVYLRNKDGLWDITEPGAAWFRRLGRPGLQPSLADRYRGFVLGEVEHQLEGVLSLVQPRFWMNPFWPTRAAANKLRQLQLAKAIGLQTPETWIGNDPALLKDRMSGHKDHPIIAKSLHSPLVSGQLGNEGKFTFTNLLSPQDLADLSDVAIAPSQFQPFVSKDFELRVTSVAGTHFAARLNTKKSGLEDLDWRSDDYTVEPFQLPGTLTETLSAFLSEIRLTYAASDFIVTPDGNFIFLESNPHGAWLWLEKRMDAYPVSQAIATLFQECMR